MTRSIVTAYYRGAKKIHINTSSDANRAVTLCVGHMQINHYGATAAEVYDSGDGVVHAVVRRNVNGHINIVYKRDPAKHETKYSVTQLLDADKKKHKGR